MSDTAKSTPWCMQGDGKRSCRCIRDDEKLVATKQAAGEPYTLEDWEAHQARVRDCR